MISWQSWFKSSVDEAYRMDSRKFWKTCIWLVHMDSSRVAIVASDPSLDSIDVYA